MISLCITTIAKTGHEVYVSPAGSDNASGSQKHPLKTLTAARDKVRGITSEGRKMPEGGITVWLGGGVYRMTESFKLVEQDSGSVGNQVLYSAMPGEEVTLSGSRIINAASWKPLGDSAKKRVHPNARAQDILELDISAMGFKHADEFAPKSQFSDEWYILDLYANGRRQSLSQWPNPAENIRGVNDPGWTTCNGSKDNFSFYYGSGGNPQDKDGTNEIDFDGTNRSIRWKAMVDSGRQLWLKGFWRTPWSPWTMRVEEINTDRQWIRFYLEPQGGMGSKYTPQANDKPLWRVGSGKEKWLAINLLEEIDAPSEWALDTVDGKIYYWPPKPIEQLKVEILDMKEPIVQLECVSHVKFAGLRIEGGQGHGIEMLGCSDVVIAGCTISNLGDTGIRDYKGMANKIQSNDIYETGGWGIEISDAGDRKKLISSKTALINNHIHHVGRLSFREAIRMNNCVGVEVAHNLMHDLPKGGVRHDMINDCLFEYNEVHNNALKESDTGTFYGYGGWTTYGNVFRYNFTHHTNRSNGFYCDDGDSGDIFYKNIVHGSITALKFGGGHDNIARNNLLIENKSQEIDDRGISRNYRLGTKYEDRLTEKLPFEEPWKSYGRRLMQEHKLTTKLWTDVLDPQWHPEWPNGCMMVDNVAVACGPFTKPSNGRVKVDGNLIIEKVEDAGFYDYANMDIRTDNTQILIKFPGLNKVFPKIGLQKDQYRTTVPTRRQVGGLVNRTSGGDPWDEDQFVD
jgi:hypothetical protein